MLARALAASATAPPPKSTSRPTKDHEAKWSAMRSATLKAGRARFSAPLADAHRRLSHARRGHHALCNAAARLWNMDVNLPAARRPSPRSRREIAFWRAHSSGLLNGPSQGGTPGARTSAFRRVVLGPAPPCLRRQLPLIPGGLELGQAPVDS